MDATSFFQYFGIPSLFLMTCMTVLGWVSRKRNWKLGDQRAVWVGSWAVIGFFIAASLATTSWIMNTDFVYNNASLVWPFCLGLEALNGHPQTSVVLLLVAIWGVINALYYALLAMLGWLLLKAFRVKATS
jgi:hypothetical protein